LVLALQFHFSCSQARSCYEVVLILEERLPWEENALTCGVEWLHLVLSTSQGTNIVHKDWLELAVNMEAWRGMVLALEMSLVQMMEQIVVGMEPTRDP
jgi:hypothetical protein